MDLLVVRTWQEKKKKRELGKYRKYNRMIPNRRVTIEKVNTKIEKIHAYQHFVIERSFRRFIRNENTDCKTDAPLALKTEKNEDKNKVLIFSFVINSTPYKRCEYSCFRDEKQQ